MEPTPVPPPGNSRRKGGASVRSGLRSVQKIQTILDESESYRPEHSVLNEEKEVEQEDGPSFQRSMEILRY